MKAGFLTNHGGFVQRDEATDENLVYIFDGHIRLLSLRLPTLGWPTGTVDIRNVPQPNDLMTAQQNGAVAIQRRDRTRTPPVSEAQIASMDDGQFMRAAQKLFFRKRLNDLEQLLLARARESAA